MEQIQEQLITLLQIIIGGALSIATVYVTMYINRLMDNAKLNANKIQDEKARELYLSALYDVDTLVKKNVIALENTTKKELLEMIADGKIEKSELKKLSSQVKENVLDQLSDDTVNVLNKNLGNVNKYIYDTIEEKLSEVKGQVIVLG